MLLPLKMSSEVDDAGHADDGHGGDDSDAELELELDDGGEAEPDEDLFDEDEPPRGRPVDVFHNPHHPDVNAYYTMMEGMDERRSEYYTVREY